MQFTASQLACGIYLYRLQDGSFVEKNDFDKIEKSKIEALNKNVLLNIIR